MQMPFPINIDPHPIAVYTWLTVTFTSAHSYFFKLKKNSQKKVFSSTPNRGGEIAISTMQNWPCPFAKSLDTHGSRGKVVSHELQGSDDGHKAGSQQQPPMISDNIGGREPVAQIASAALSIGAVL